MRVTEVKKVLIYFYLVFILVILGFTGILVFEDVIDKVKVEAATIIVDSKGQGDYTRIQDAIDNASAGDTIIVANGTYFESLVIKKSNINLIGNSSIDCRIIHSYNGSDELNDFSSGIDISGSGVNISGFNIIISCNYTYGIYLNSSSSSNTNINGNNITTYDNRSYGLFVYKSSNNIFKENRIRTYGRSGYGIYLYNSSINNSIEKNNISTNNWYGYGIHLYNSTNNKILKNSIRTFKGNSWGVYINKFSNENKIDANNINTSGESGNDIYLEQSSKNTVMNNQICSSQYGNGISLENSSNNNIINNQIEGNRNNGIIIIENSNYNNISNNIIKTIRSEGTGINVIESSNTIIKNNIIDLTGFNRHGISIEMSNNNTLMENHLRISGNLGSGIGIFGSFNKIYNNTVNLIDGVGGISTAYLNSNDIKNNIINISSKYSGGTAISVWKASKINITNNRIDNNANNGKCISLYDSSNNNVIGNFMNNSGLDNHAIYLSNFSKSILLKNIINNKYQSEHGIFLYGNSNHVTIKYNKIFTSGQYGHGIHIRESKDVNILDCNISTNGTNAMGIYLIGNKANITNSTINSINSYDIKISNGGEISLINSHFNTTQVTQNFGGVLKVKNYLSIQVFDNDSVSTISGVDIEIKDNNRRIYSSVGYGGKDAPTDSKGIVKNIIITDRLYNYSNTATENSTNVKVKKMLNELWEEERTDIDMSSSHFEFFYRDETPPPIPSGLKVTRIPGTNTLNISWDLNLDTVQYLLYGNHTGQWEVLHFKEHPNNWTLDYFLDDNNWYYYKIQAIDKVGLSSGLSNIVTYYLLDILPPEPPNGLSVVSITNDSIFLIWNPNIETDLDGYNIYRNRIANPTVWSNPINSISNETENYIDTGLDEFTTYYYVITAFDEVPNESDFSNIAFGTTSFKQYSPEINDSIDDLEIPEDTFDNKAINLFDWFKDKNNDQLVFWVEGNKNISVHIYQNNGTVVLIPENNWNGIETLVFYASDGISNISDSINITITPVNDPPGPVKIVTPLNNTIVNDSIPINLTAICFDPDVIYGDGLTFKWSSNITGDIGVGDNLTEIYFEPGYHLITVNVTDIEEMSSQAKIQIIVLSTNKTKQNYIDPDKPDGGGENKFEFTNLITISLVGLSIIIIIILLFLLILRKKNPRLYLSKNEKSQVKNLDAKLGRQSIKTDGEEIAGIDNDKEIDLGNET